VIRLPRVLQADRSEYGLTAGQANGEILIVHHQLLWLSRLQDGRQLLQVVHCVSVCTLTLIIQMNGAILVCCDCTTNQQYFNTEYNTHVQQTYNTCV